MAEHGGAVFRDLTDKRSAGAAFFNVDDLIAAITEYINALTRNPKPFIWTATAKDILAKVKRARRGPAEGFISYKASGGTLAARSRATR